MTTKELQILKSKMPKGYRQMIQEKTRLSIAMIDYVFSGARKNQAVIIAALDILDDYNREQAEIKSRIQKVIESANT